MPGAVLVTESVIGFDCTPWYSMTILVEGPRAHEVRHHDAGLVRADVDDRSRHAVEQHARVRDGGIEQVVGDVSGRQRCRSDARTVRSRCSRRVRPARRSRWPRSATAVATGFGTASTDRLTVIDAAGWVTELGELIAIVPV